MRLPSRWPPWLTVRNRHDDVKPEVQSTRDEKADQDASIAIPPKIIRLIIVYEKQRTEEAPLAQAVDDFELAAVAGLPWEAGRRA